MKKLGKVNEEDEDGNKDKEQDKETDVNSMSLRNHNLAMKKKNKKQEQSAEKAMKKCDDAALQSGVLPGAVVSIKVDYRTHYIQKA